MEKISFVAPCYNDADEIGRMVDSIMDQDYPEIEMIIVNDGSTDNSKQIIDGLVQKYPEVKAFHLETNQGACKARNYGAKQATGKYLSFLPADAVLYPGMARIWVDTLEENPDYDFLYGGYRFVDKESRDPIQGCEYFFEPFDPYLLETTNYIDGSFPIKTESFWKYAKLMGQEDGLWDSKIKSLQDWDFWLSVVKNGGKGIYVRDIFFETTLPHPGGLSFDSSNNWIDRTNAIKDKHGIPHRKLCIASLGAGFHAKRIAYILDADFKEMPSYKPHEYQAIYAIGFYPQFAQLQDQMFFNVYGDVSKGRVPSKKIVHFVGSDIWQMYNLSIRSLDLWKAYFKANIDEVLCEAEFTRVELEKLGIEAKVVPIPPVKLFDLLPLPEEFTVAVYMPKVNAEFYNPKLMLELVEKMPEVKFKFFGNPDIHGQDIKYPNLYHAGYVGNMEDLIKQCSAIIRIPQHDGLPISVIEFILAGRYSIQSTPLNYTIQITEPNIDSLLNAVNETKKLVAVGQNIEGANYWRKVMDHDKYREVIKELAGYNAKEYWEKRAISWHGQANTQTVELTEVLEEVKELSPGSVIDLGCGNGRWTKALKDIAPKYKGIDISEKLVEIAKQNFPDTEFEAIKVEDLKPCDKYDLAFSYTCFEHIPEVDVIKAIEAVKGVAKKLILIEPENFPTRYYCHDHKYRELFNVIKEKKLADKTIFVCDLEITRN